MEPNEIHLDGFNLLCGKMLGEGVHRKVFECRICPELVVKVEFDTNWRYFANVHEMRFWNNASNEVAQWLAPCKYLSPDGRVLLQRRVEPARREDLPEQLPAFLGDFKLDNYGMLDGRFVCVDYAMVPANPSLRLKKVIW